MEVAEGEQGGVDVKAGASHAGVSSGGKHEEELAGGSGTKVGLDEDSSTEEDMERCVSALLKEKDGGKSCNCIKCLNKLGMIDGDCTRGGGSVRGSTGTGR